LYLYKYIPYKSGTFDLLGEVKNALFINEILGTKTGYNPIYTSFEKYLRKRFIIPTFVDNKLKLSYKTHRHPEF